jgi:MFS family permease
VFCSCRQNNLTPCFCRCQEKRCRASRESWIIFANVLLGINQGLMLPGLGTTMVHPTLLAAIGDVAHPSWRGAAVGVYRLWRDLGYAVGALIAGVLADVFGMTAAIGAVGALTIASGALVALRMHETLRHGLSTRPRRFVAHPRKREILVANQGRTRRLALGRTWIRPAPVSP